ncbi:MAG: glycosyltransferase [Paramuribaculum sp.]|nr:glycosyltransferase [Paramuribaculum sp.]
MNQIKVSVLVPVYGVAKYIERCARSLFEQTMTYGIEYIFIDDSTPDNSIEILLNTLAKYPERKNQVKIVRHETNLGLAEARVTALNVSHGEYVIHCDSDDWVAPEMYELMYQKAYETGADIVGCDYTKAYGKSHIVQTEKFTLPHKHIITEILKGRKIGGYLWNRLIRRDFYLKHKFRADKGITLFEDMAVTIPMHLVTDKIAYVNKPLYFHRLEDKTSMSGKLNEKSIKSSVTVLQKLAMLSLSPVDRKSLYSNLKYQLFTRLNTFHSYNPQEWRHYELPFIRQSGLKLSTYEKASKWLIEHRMPKIQHGLMLINKLASKSAITNLKILLKKLHPGNR